MTHATKPQPFTPQPLKPTASDADATRLLPHNFDAEEALLGALLNGGRVSVCQSEELTPDDFYIVQHGWIYAAMCAVKPDAEDGLVLSVEGVAALLTEQNQLAQIVKSGETGYLALRWLQTFRGGELFPAVRGLARTIRADAVRRRGIQALSQVAQELWSGKDDPTLVIDRGLRTLEQVKPFNVNAEFVRGALSSTLHETILGDQAQRQVWHAVPWTALADRAPVTVDGDLIVVAGPAGSGKSALLAGWAEFEAQQGNQAAYVHTEMTKSDVFNRRLVKNSKVVSWAALQKPGDLTDPQWTAIVEAGAQLETWLPRLDYWHAGQPSESRLFTVMQRMVDDFGTRCFVLDYLNDVIPDLKRRDSNGAETWRNLLARLELFNNRNGTRIITGVQINREGNAYMIGEALRHKATLYLTIKPQVLKNDFPFEFDGVPYRYFAGDKSPLVPVTIEKYRAGGWGTFKLLYVGPRFLWADVPTNFDDGSDDPGAYEDRVYRGAKE